VTDISTPNDRLSSVSMPPDARQMPGSNGRVLVFSRSSLLLFFVVAFLVAPKINVVSVLRVEDFVFLMGLPILAWRYVPAHTILPNFLLWYVAYLFFAFVSAFINFGNLGVFGIVNVIRQLQYLIWFVVGAQMAVGIPPARFERAMSILAGILIVWWLGEASGIVPKIGKFTGASGRVTLNTSGPYEISVVVVFLMLLVRKKILLLGLMGILLASQARITLAAALVTYLIFRPRHALAFGIPAVGLVFALVMTNPDALANSRFLDTMTPLEMWRAFMLQIQESPIITNLPEYRHYAYDTLWDQIGGSSDVSFEIRIIRWALIIKSLTGDAAHLLFGWGPGAWGAAVDSHVIRFLGEVGIAGFFMVAMFVIKSVSSPSAPRQYRAALFVLIICSLFIDVMTSSKIMSFLWMMLGYLFVRDRVSTTASEARRQGV